MYLHVHREQCSVECTVLVHCTLYNVNIDDKSKHQEGQSICCGGSLVGNVMVNWLEMWWIIGWKCDGSLVGYVR